MEWISWPILIGIALVITLHLHREIKRVAEIRAHGIKTIGLVTGHKLRVSKSSTLRPLIEYTTHEGQTFELEGRIGASIPWRSKGEKVTVLYDEQNPESFVLEDETDESSPYLGIFCTWLFVLGAFIAKWQAE